MWPSRSEPNGFVPSVALQREERLERRQGRQRQDLAVRREAIADRPAAPAEQRAHRVVAAERRRRGGERVTARRRVAILQVDAERTHFLADPAVQRGEAHRVRRRPQLVLVLARRRQEELARAQLQLVESEGRARLRIRLDETCVASPSASRRPTPLDVQIEVLVGRPVHAELRGRRKARRDRRLTSSRPQPPSSHDAGPVAFTPRAAT